MSENLNRLSLTAALGLAICLGLLSPQGPAMAGSVTLHRPGSEQSANFPSVSAALESGAVTGGDRLELTPGDHGPLILKGQRFDPPVTLSSGADGRARVSHVVVRQSSGMVIRDLDVWPDSPADKVRTAVVHADRDAADIVFDGLDIKGGAGAEAYRGWSLEQWLAYRNKGVQINGTDITLSNSTIIGVTTAIGIQGRRARVEGNEVKGFSKDGMRVLGSGAAILGNTVRDCVDVDKNHDDGLQSWSGKGSAEPVVSDVRVEANRILEWTGPADHPLRCKLQGIGLFDGPYDGWVIENNLIAVSTRHGISLHDMRNARVVNNTVTHIDGEVGRKPWIKLRFTSLEAGNVVANNVSHALHLMKQSSPWPNTVIRYPARIFRDPLGGDFRLTEASGMIGKGDPEMAPEHDITGRPRPAGMPPNLGAFGPQSR